MDQPVFGRVLQLPVNTISGCDRGDDVAASMGVVTLLRVSSLHLVSLTMSPALGTRGCWCCRGGDPGFWWWRLRPGGGACLGVADKGISRPDWGQLRQGCGAQWAGVDGGRWSVHLREKSLFRFTSKPATAVPAGATPFLGSVVVEVCSSSLRLGLRRETSDPLDRAMKASSRLSPPWAHRLGAGYDWETGGLRHLRRGWRHLRRMVC